MDIGAAVGRKQGLSEEQLAGIADFENRGCFDAREKAVMRYAEEMCRTPVEVPDELFAQLKHYFNNTQMVELTASVALENFRARFNHALELPSDGLCELPPDHPVRRQASATQN